VFHTVLVAVSAFILFLLLKMELDARYAAEETLRREHEGLETLIRQRAEEYAKNLRHEGSVLQAIMENTQTLLVYLDPKMNFVHANSAYVNSCGHARDELIGHNHFALFPNEENEAIFRKACLTGEPVSFLAKPFEYPDQPWRGITYWDWSLVPVKDAAGTVSGLVFSLRDVTEEHLATQRRENHLARLSALIKVTEQTLRERTAESLFRSIADAAREVTGARVSVAGHGSTEGKFSIRAVSRAQDAPTCPTNIPASTDAGGLYRTLMKAEETLRLTDENLRSHPEWRGLPPGHYPLRGLLGTQMKGGDGSNLGFIMVSDKVVGDFSQEDEALLSQLSAIASLSLQHINARTEAEHFAAHLDAIFGSMTNAVIVFDVSGIARRANPAAIRLIGFDPVGSPLQLLLTRLGIRDDDGRPYDKSTLPSQRALEGEVVIGARLILSGTDGVERIIRSSSSPLLINGSILGAVTVWTDETERERLIRQVELERARLKAIIDNAPGGIVMADDQARIQLLNPAAERL
jgi:PAS domain S-box-containing protein